MKLPLKKESSKKSSKNHVKINEVTSKGFKVLGDNEKKKLVEKQKNTNQRGYGIDDSELANDSELDDFLNGFGRRG